MQSTASCLQADRIIWNSKHWFPSLPFRQFQVLFNSLFNVLCIFPSRYLFAIGFSTVFSFRWNLPPTLSCNPKQLDSLTNVIIVRYTGVSPYSPLCSKRLNQIRNTLAFRPQFSASTDSHLELFPLQSPLLRKSWLVSFPPLSNMLKFSGSSYFIWDYVLCRCVLSR